MTIEHWSFTDRERRRSAKLQEDDTALKFKFRLPHTERAAIDPWLFNENRWRETRPPLVSSLVPIPIMRSERLISIESTWQSAQNALIWYFADIRGYVDHMAPGRPIMLLVTFRRIRDRHRQQIGVDAVPEDMRAYIEHLVEKHAWSYQLERVIDRVRVHRRGKSCAAIRLTCERPVPLTTIRLPNLQELCLGRVAFDLQPYNR